MLDDLPVSAEDVAACQPRYEQMPGWQSPTLGIRSAADLPQAARDYLKRIETLCGAPAHIVSTGPDRLHTIINVHPFD
jgi:adenylosuccinate synthase